MEAQSGGLIHRILRVCFEHGACPKIWWGMFMWYAVICISILVFIEVVKRIIFRNYE